MVQISELVGILGLVLLAYKYGYWKGRVHGARKVEPNKPRTTAIQKLAQVVKPRADTPGPAVTGIRRPEYTRPGVGEEEL